MALKNKAQVLVVLMVVYCASLLWSHGASPPHSSMVSPAALRVTEVPPQVMELR